MKNKKTFGNIILLLTSVIWGLAFVFQRTGMDSIEPITFNAARMIAAAIFLVVLSVIVDQQSKKSKQNLADAESDAEIKKRKKATLVGGILCGLFLAASSTAQQMGIVHTTAGKAGFITAMYMLFVPIINLIIFRKKTGARVLLAVALGLVGMYLLCIKDDFTFTSGDALILLCALLFSGHILCCDRFAPFCDPIKLSAIQFIVSGVICSALAFLTESPSIDKLISALIPILYCGILSGGVGYTLQIVGQKHTEPTTASLIMSLEAVFAALAGAILLHERMSTQELIGSIVMFGAIILVQLPEKVRK